MFEKQVFGDKPKPGVTDMMRPFDPSSGKLEPDSGARPDWSMRLALTAEMTREHVNIPGIMPDEV